MHLFNRIILTYFLSFVIYGCAIPPDDKETLNPFIESSEHEIARLTQQALNEFSRSRFEAAEEHFSKALELSPDNFSLKHNLALTWLRLGEFEFAKSIFEKLIVKHDKTVSLYFELGNLYAANGELSRSSSYFQTAAMLREDELKTVSNTTLKNTETPVEIILTRKPPEIPLPTIYTALAEVSLRLGEYESAICASFNDYRTSNQEIESLKRYIRLLIPTGSYHLADKLLVEEVPSVVRERSMQLLHTLAYIGIGEGNLEKYLSYERKALEAFDQEQQYLDEIKFIAELFTDPLVEHIVPTQLKTREEFWPAELKIMVTGFKSKTELYEVTGIDYKDFINTANALTKYLEQI
jgi:tetratricopeptide (TPR) repeat protein